MLHDYGYAADGVIHDHGEVDELCMGHDDELAEL